MSNYQFQWIPFVSYKTAGFRDGSLKELDFDTDGENKKKKQEDLDRPPQPSVIIQSPLLTPQLTPPIITTPVARPTIPEERSAVPIVTAPEVKVETPKYSSENPVNPITGMPLYPPPKSQHEDWRNQLPTFTDVTKMNSVGKKPPKIEIPDGVTLSSELENEILEKLLQFGISGTITSSIRNSTLPNGKPSYHNSGKAFDFIPPANLSFAELYRQLETSGALEYLNKKGYYIYYEDKNNNPNCTGPHFHIGKDIVQNNIKYMPKHSNLPQIAKFGAKLNPFRFNR